MKSLKLLLVISTSNDSLCDYYPRDIPSELLNEVYSASQSLKCGRLSGIIETKMLKFSYRHFVPDNNTKEHLVLFLCSDKNYKDSLIEKFFNEAILKISSNLITDDFLKLNSEGKLSLAKLFVSYKRCDNNDEPNLVENWSSINLDMGSKREFSTFEIQPGKRKKSIFVRGFSITVDDSLIGEEKKEVEEEEEYKIDAKQEKNYEINKYIKMKYIYLIILVFLLLFYLMCLILYLRD